MKRDNKILRLCVLCVWVRHSLAVTSFINQPLFAIHFADAHATEKSVHNLPFFSQVVKFYDNGTLQWKNEDEHEMIPLSSYWKMQMQNIYGSIRYICDEA